jgi:shikimate dehydrogenase
MIRAEVIGDPIARSKSPAIHRFWIERLGLAAAYDAVSVSSSGLAEYLSERRGEPEWRGCNVTMPHKQAVIPLLDRLDPLAERIGAVNTVVREADGTLSGYNTDAPGFLEPLAGVLAGAHFFRMARVLGTGGAGRAIVASLAGEGFVIVLAGRDPARARALLDQLAPGDLNQAIDLAHFVDRTEFAFDDRAGCLDLVVNASPLGMRGQPPLAFDWSHAPPGAIAYDIVTDPPDTPFLKAARAAGHRTFDGVSMLIGQAALAFKRFFDIPPPRDDAALRARIAA